MLCKTFSAALLLFCIGCGGSEQPSSLPTSDLANTDDGASKPETRVPAEGLSKEYAEEIVGLTQVLETGGDVSYERIDISVQRINEAKGFTVVLCASVLSPLMGDDQPLNVGKLALITSAAAMIKEPGLESNLPALATASLESLAKIYGQFLSKGGPEMPGWNDLARRVETGELAQWVSTDWPCAMTVDEVRGLKPADAPHGEPVILPYVKK